MTFKSKMRQSLPQDLLRLYTQIFYPEEMAKYRGLRETPPSSPHDYSLVPFLQRRAIFFHIPKCAGISVAETLFGCRAGGHMGLHSYKNAFSHREFSSFFKFTFVRNPWDRLASAYFFLREGGINEQDKHQAAQSVDRFADFTAFVEGFISQEDFGKFLHLKPQYSFVCASPESAPEVDFIGRYEQVRDDFATISGELGLDLELPHRNAGASRPRDYRTLYTDRTAEIVAQAYARDIALFGYTF